MLQSIYIKIGLGINELLFGATKAETEAVYGKPDEIEVLDELEDNTSTVYHYWKNGFSLFFDDNNNNIFCCVEIDNKNSLLWEQKIFTLNEKEIINLFKSNGYLQHESEIHEWGEKRLSFEAASIDFYFEKNKLTSINYGKPILPSTIILHSN